MRSWIAATLAIVLTCGSTSPLAYLKLGALLNGQVIAATWRQQPIGYFISERSGGGLSATDLRGAVERATATWSNVASANVRFQFQGMTTAPAEGIDGRTTLGFLDRPGLDRVLGATSFLIDTTSGEIAEADIFFNTLFAFSVAPNGEANAVDLESIVLHELGHLLGLGHSGIGETQRFGSVDRRVLGSGAVMFPIAMSAPERVLHADDMAGISDLYPAPPTLDTGGIVGRVTKNGRGVIGAHVVAFNPETGILVGNFTLSDAGEFVIARLPPGPHILRVEPLDDADPNSFFPGAIDTDFRVTYAPRMVAVPHGGSSPSIEIKVQAK